jgi:hypothetical protein
MSIMFFFILCFTIKWRFVIVAATYVTMVCYGVEYPISH